MTVVVRLAPQDGLFDGCGGLPTRSMVPNSFGLHDFLSFLRSEIDSIVFKTIEFWAGFEEGG